MATIKCCHTSTVEKNVDVWQRLIAAIGSLAVDKHVKPTGVRGPAKSIHSLIVYDLHTEADVINIACFNMLKG